MFDAVAILRRGDLRDPRQRDRSQGGRDQEVGQVGRTLPQLRGQEGHDLNGSCALVGLAHYLSRVGGFDGVQRILRLHPQCREGVGLQCQ